MTHIHTGPCHDEGLPLAFVLYIFSRGERERTPAGQQKRVVCAILPRDNLLCLLWGGYACPQGHESAPQAETLYETVILTGLPPDMQEETGGGRHCPPR